MRYFLGIDGGGSNIRAAVVDEHAEMVEHVKISQNVNPTSRGIEAVFELFHQLNVNLGKYSENTIGIFVSLAGAATREQITMIKKRLAEIFVSAKDVKVLPDAYGSLVANFKNEAGLLAICGTGSVVVGKEKGEFFDFERKDFYRAGGWGYLLGDEASGYWIVKTIFQAYLKYADGIEEYDPCFDIFESRFSKIPRETLSYFYKPEMRRDIAALSREFLQSDSILVWHIVEEGIKAFYRRINAIRKRIKSQTNTLVYMGGMFESERYKKIFFENNRYDLVLKSGAEKLEVELGRIALDSFI